MSVHRRSTRFTVHDLVAESRAGVSRLSAAELADALERDATIVVVDTRQTTDRSAHGWIAGSVHVPRTVLEWRVDPASGYSDPLLADASTTPRRRLQRRLLVEPRRGQPAPPRLRSDATDLVGGVEGWKRAGFPVERD